VVETGHRGRRRRNDGDSAQSPNRHRLARGLKGQVSIVAGNAIRADLIDLLESVSSAARLIQTRRSNSSPIASIVTMATSNR
jgi:hypothetical protein